MTPQAIPLTAWEQAAIIVLFCLFVLALLTLLLRIVTVIKPIVSDTNDSFQKFILARDTQWQQYLRDLRESDRKVDEDQAKAFAERNKQVVEALNALAGQIAAMQIFNVEHDTKMTVAVETMTARVNGNSRARPKA